MAARHSSKQAGGFIVEFFAAIRVAEVAPVLDAKELNLLDALRGEDGTSRARPSLKLRRAGYDAGLMRLHGLFNLGEHVGMIGSDVSLFGRIATEVKQEWWIVDFCLRLAITGLCLEVGFPFAEATGKQLVTSIIEVRPGW